MIVAGIHSLAVILLDKIPTNNYWREKYSDIAQANQAWQAKKNKSNMRQFNSYILYSGSNKKLFDVTMAPYFAFYFDNPFQLVIQRRYVVGDATSTFISCKNNVSNFVM